MGKEIERKWMPNKAPEWIGKWPHTEIIQGYMCTDPTVRVRKDGEEYYLTYKGKGLIEREEYNLPLNQAAFEHLLDKCDGIILRKDRYRVALPTGHTAEVDLFKDDYAGRVYVEVEFADVTEAMSFAAPEWFGEEVTGKPGYSNGAMSKCKSK